MKKVANFFGILTVLCFFILFLWGEKIRSFSQTGEYLLMFICGIGFILNHIQFALEMEHERD